MQKIDSYISRHFHKIFWILSGSFFVLYLMQVGGDTIWTDEAYSFAMVKHSFSEIWTITAADVHPPIYYWYLKILTAPFHYSLLAAQIASILPYLFILIFGGIQIKKYFNEKTAILFMVMFFCFPFAMSYSVEVRMYSLASACVFACAVFAYRFWLEHGRWKDMTGLVVSGVLAAYSHYFAFVSICMIYGLLLFAIAASKDSLLIKKWLLSVVISIILYAPWLSSFINQLVYKVNNEYWIGEITVRTLLGYLDGLFGLPGFPAGASALYSLLFSVAYLACFVWTLRSKEKREIILCICCLLIPVGTLTVGVVASILVRPVFVIRYLAPSVPLLVTFMAIVLGKANNDTLFCGVLCVVLMGGISNYGFTVYSKHTNQNYLPIKEYHDVDVYIVIDQPHVCGTLGYYVTDKSIYYGNKPSAANPYPNRAALADFNCDTVDCAIMLLNVGETPPDEYDSIYYVEYLGQWKCEENTDAYLLTKKP